MDRTQRTTDIIKAYYKYKKTSEASDFLKEVCRFFDYIKNENLSDADLNFLIFIANEVGIPQYYDLLEKKFTDKRLKDESFNTLTLGSIIHEASLLSGETKLHRYQKNVLEKFTIDSWKRNRYVLTAPTSFGKTFLVYEIIRKMKYRSVLLIFPAISLLAENYAHLRELDTFSDYKIYSLSEESYNPEEKNIFIFTPERFLSFMDNHQDLHFDFAFIDEVYKIDNSFIIDQENEGENERDAAYRLALEFICGLADDILLAGPYMALPNDNSLDKKSFSNFAEDNGFKFLQYNKFEIVTKDYWPIKNKKQYVIEDKIVPISAKNKTSKIASIIQHISSPNENTIVYCGRKSDTERYAREILEDNELVASFQEKCKSVHSDTFEIFLNHLERIFGNDWIVFRALKARIGIHHGLIPKYIQKEIINLFNEGSLICLFSTTTITEGVNTSAKNIIITSDKKGQKKLKQFDAKNIAGRAGRFHQHYSGRVIDLSNSFTTIVNSEQEILGHKNYDTNSSKTDIDYQITKDKYLTEEHRKEKELIHEKIIASNIPREVFDSFRVVGPKDKLELYKSITQMPPDSINELSLKLIQSHSRTIDWGGFQNVIDVICPIVKEQKLKKLIEIKTGKTQKYSLITVLLHNYLQNGFFSMIEYYIREQHNTKDMAVRKVADHVYNIFKYHLVKYLGVFDIFYRYHVAMTENRKMDAVPGLGLLLQKLEYNAITPEARKLSDFGVPFGLIDYYDNTNRNKQKVFDDYEKYIDGKIGILFLE